MCICLHIQRKQLGGAWEQGWCMQTVNNFMVIIMIVVIEVVHSFHTLLGCTGGFDAGTASRESNCPLWTLRGRWVTWLSHTCHMTGSQVLSPVLCHASGGASILCTCRFDKFPPHLRQIHSSSIAGAILWPPGGSYPAGWPPPLFPGPLMGEGRASWVHSPGACTLCHISDGEHTLWPTFCHRRRGQLKPSTTSWGSLVATGHGKVVTKYFDPLQSYTWSWVL